MANKVVLERPPVSRTTGLGARASLRIIENVVCAPIEKPAASASLMLSGTRISFAACKTCSSFDSMFPGMPGRTPGSPLSG